MNIVVFGSTDLSLAVLEFLYKNNYHIAAIVTVPATFTISYKPEGVVNSRYINLQIWALEKNIPVIIYDNVAKTMNSLLTLNRQLDFAIIVGWYHLVPKKLRALFSKGCSGFHASLLPQLRGGAPLNWAILLGYQETGVSFFELSDGVDDGLLYDQEKFSISSTDLIGDLVQKSEVAILKILERTLLKIQDQTLKPYSQEGIVSYSGQRIPEDSKIDWTLEAEIILRLIRASSKPYFGAYTFLDNEKIIIWDAAFSDLCIYGVPGQIMIINNFIYIACGNKQALVLKDVEDNSLLIKSNHKRLK